MNMLVMQKQHKLQFEFFQNGLCGLDARAGTTITTLFL